MESVGMAVGYVLLVTGIVTGCGVSSSSVQENHTANLHRAKVFLAAGDFRRAVEACRQEVQEFPAAESYLYLTYVYHALDAYVESLARTDRWVQLEHLYLNLVSGEPEALVDPSNVLVRIEKELIQSAARQQADVTAELASRLDKSVVERLWTQQAAWRKKNPDGWWFAIPPEWQW